MRKITSLDIIIELVILTISVALLYEVHINLVYAVLLQIGHKAYILIDTRLAMIKRAKDIADMLKQLDMRDLGNGMYLSKKEEDDVQSDDGSDKK